MKRRKYQLHLQKQMQRFGIAFPIMLALGYFELSLGFLPALPYVVLILLLCSCLFFCSYREHTRIDHLALFFILIVPITIFMATPRAIFRSWERFAVFALVFSFVSPMLQNESFRRYRRLAFYSFIIMASIIGTLSFFAYYLGVNFMIYDMEFEDEYLNNAGTFGGLTRHSMMLGPLSGLGGLGAMYIFLQKRKIYWLIPAVLCACSVLFSASRSAFLAMNFGFLVLLISVSRNTGDLLKRLFWVLLVLVGTYPVWNGAMDAVKEKQMRHQNDTELFDSRTEKVECRWKEFSSSPIYGVGFSAVDPKFKDNYSDNGTIEPGSSWLGVLSMTGLLGFGFVVALFVRSIRTLWRRRFGLNILILACIALVSSHMTVEGYVFASGNPMSFICWLLVGLGFDAIYSKSPEPKRPTRFSIDRMKQRRRLAQMKR